MIYSKITHKGDQAGESDSIFYLQHTHADTHTHTQNNCANQLLMEHSLTQWVRINPWITAAVFEVPLVAGKHLLFFLHRKSLGIYILPFLSMSVPAKGLH